MSGRTSCSRHQRVSPCTIYTGSRAVPTACEVLSRLDWPVSRTRPATLPARIIDYNVMIKYRLPQRQPVRPWVPPGTLRNLGHIFGVRRRENRGASGYERMYVAHMPGRTDSMTCGSTTSGLDARPRYWMAAYRSTSSPRDGGTTRQPCSAGTSSEAKNRTTGVAHHRRHPGRRSALTRSLPSHVHARSSPAGPARKDKLGTKGIIQPSDDGTF